MSTAPGHQVPFDRGDGDVGHQVPLHGGDGDGDGDFGHQVPFDAGDGDVGDRDGEVFSDVDDGGVRVMLAMVMAMFD